MGETINDKIDEILEQVALCARGGLEERAIPKEAAKEIINATLSLFQTHQTSRASIYAALLLEQLIAKHGLQDVTIEQKDAPGE